VRTGGAGGPPRKSAGVATWTSTYKLLKTFWILRDHSIRLGDAESRSKGHGNKEGETSHWATGSWWEHVELC